MNKITWKRGQSVPTDAAKRLFPKLEDCIDDAAPRKIYSVNTENHKTGRWLVCKLNADHPQFEENRALIEAAPALLNLALLVAEILERRKVPTFKELKHLYLNACAAIEKATVQK